MNENRLDEKHTQFIYHFYVGEARDVIRSEISEISWNIPIARPVSRASFSACRNVSSESPGCHSKRTAGEVAARDRLDSHTWKIEQKTPTEETVGREDKRNKARIKPEQSQKNFEGCWREPKKRHKLRGLAWLWPDSTTIHLHIWHIWHIWHICMFPNEAISKGQNHGHNQPEVTLKETTNGMPCHWDLNSFRTLLQKCFEKKNISRNSGFKDAK